MKGPRTKSGSLAFTVNAWAGAIGCDPKSIVRRLAKQRIPYESGGLITAHDLIKCFTGDKEAAMVEKLQAETDRIHREELEAQGELVRLPVMEEKIWQRLLMPLRQELELMPEKVSALANPNNPSAALGALRAWVEEIKRTLLEVK